MRLPRPCRFLARRFILTCKLGIGEPLALYLGHRQMETVSVIQRVILHGAIVEAEHLFRNIAVEMEWLNSHVGSAQTAFQQRPKVLNALSVNLAANVLFNVIDR